LTERRFAYVIWYGLEHCAFGCLAYVIVHLLGSQQLKSNELNMQDYFFPLARGSGEGFCCLKGMLSAGATVFTVAQQM